MTPEAHAWQFSVSPARSSAMPHIPGCSPCNALGVTADLLPALKTPIGNAGGAPHATCSLQTTPQPGCTTTHRTKPLAGPQSSAFYKARGPSYLINKEKSKEGDLLALPWSGSVGAGLAADSVAVTSTAQRMRDLQVNIPLLRLLLGDCAQPPLHGAPSAAVSCRGGKESQGRVQGIPPRPFAVWESPASHSPFAVWGRPPSSPLCSP